MPLFSGDLGGDSGIKTTHVIAYLFKALGGSGHPRRHRYQAVAVRDLSVLVVG